MNPAFSIRTVSHTDLDQLIQLENEWPENARATAEQLAFRIDKFQQGYFIAEDQSGIIASIISVPYHYQPDNLSNFSNWQSVVDQCYQSFDVHCNALYIIAGTCKSTPYGGEVFDGGVTHVVELAKNLDKTWVIGGCLLPGYARYLQKHGELSAADYAFRQSSNRLIDPLVEKYRRLDFHIPDKKHVIANYFLHEPSCNYSALVVRNVKTNP